MEKGKIELGEFGKRLAGRGVESRAPFLQCVVENVEKLEGRDLSKYKLLLLHTVVFWLIPFTTKTSLSSRILGIEFRLQEEELI